MIDALMFFLSRLLRRPIHVGDVIWEDRTVVQNTGKERDS